MEMTDYSSLLLRSLPLFCKGFLMTIQILICSASLSLMLGLFFGIVSYNRWSVGWLRWIVEGVTFVLRGVPFFVQLLLVYFVFPHLLGFDLEPFPASVIALGLCSSGYVAQIIRGGLNAISHLQWESAFVLGLSRIQSLRYVILPQLLRHVLPMLNNELDALLKSTSIVSSIGVLELTRAGMNIVSREMQPVPTYLTIALFYLCMSALLNVLSRRIEKKLAYAKS
ncbi:MAG: putative glutamine transport system permease protein glnP [Chlamydiota bacterium]